MTNPQVNAFFSLRLPDELSDALVDLQGRYEDRVEPQRREHMHITLAFLRNADAGRLADAAALISDGTWPGVPLTFTGEIRHGSWALRKDPDYRHDPATVQTKEQVRLGIKLTSELSDVRARLERTLELPPEKDFWPHVTLGLARRDIPAKDLDGMALPSGTRAAAELELQQELTATHFRVLARAELTAHRPESVPAARHTSDVLGRVL